MTDSSAPRLVLEIGTLRLNGFGVEHRDRFEAALHERLQQLLEEGGLPGKAGRRSRLLQVADTLRHDAAGGDPETAAHAVARAIWDRLELGPATGPRRPR